MIDPSLLAEPVMSFWPLVIGAIASLAGSAMEASKTDAPMTPGAQMSFTKDEDTVSEALLRGQEKSPWMQSIGNSSSQSPTGFGLGLQQPANQSITLGEMYR